ncbi:MAG: hypothetical protein R3345_01375 [Fulvivirga sp.]|nr:hypothetical protein [Fulvivirga sp.]
MKKFALYFFLIAYHYATGQQTGKVDYPYLGISFEIPAQWVGQEQQGFFLMASNTMPGYILLTTHDKSTKTELKALARQGIADQNINLQLDGEVEDVAGYAVGGYYNGTIEWQPARAYIIAALNDFGQGVLIMSATTSDQFNNQYKNLAIEVMRSLVFYEGKGAEIVAQVKQYLQNSRLTYKESYYSPGSTEGDISGGYSSEVKIDLCREFFRYHGNYEMTMSGDNASGLSQSNDQGDGTWKVIAGAGGTPILVLNFYNGEQFEYEITQSDNKLYLNGQRYFRTTSGEYAPGCN